MSIDSATCDTIAAIASPPGRSARALIRLSGPAVGRVVEDLLESAPAGRGIAAARLRLSDQAVLPVLVTRFVAPRSPTGQDACEIQLPGNPKLVERALTRVLTVPGVRLAHPGEFSARGYFAGKLTLDQAEGVAAIIAASNDDELTAARALLLGDAGRRYGAWTDRAASLLSLVEAGIDFSDQDEVVAISAHDLRAGVRALAGDIERHAGPAATGEVRTAQPRVVLVGEPSAGKSTLFNALLGRPRAVTAPAPGTTRDALVEELDLNAEHPGSQPVLLVDLPGLESHPSGAHDPSVQRSAQHAIAGAQVLVLCDPAGRFDDQLEARIDMRPTIRVRTKADLIAPAAPTGSPPAAAMPVCALDGFNLGPLRRAIADAAFAVGATPTIGVPRHRRALALAMRALARVDRLTGPDHAGPAASDQTRTAGALVEPALIASHLREALDELGSITGVVSPDDVIGRVFATFCVGK